MEFAGFARVGEIEGGAEAVNLAALKNHADGAGDGGLGAEVRVDEFTGGDELVLGVAEERIEDAGEVYFAAAAAGVTATGAGRLSTGVGRRFEVAMVPRREKPPAKSIFRPPVGARLLSCVVSAAT